MMKFNLIINTLDVTIHGFNHVNVKFSPQSVGVTTMLSLTSNLRCWIERG